MTEPDREEAAGPVAPRPPVLSRYGLVLTVYVSRRSGTYLAWHQGHNCASDARRDVA
jgi:hypothetical protein